MRRRAFIFIILLTLTTGVWSDALLAVAAASCIHKASADVAIVSDEHDCCRARVGEPHSDHSLAQDNSHAATHEHSVPQNKVAGSHAGMNCRRAEESAPEAKVAALGERELSCLACCAGRSGGTPTTAIVIAPEQNKVKRDAGNAQVNARAMFAPTPHGVSHLLPTQHAPPPTEQRRHMLLSVFLI